MSSEVCNVLDLVTACTAKTPDAPAVVAGGRRVTYQELEARANGLAHQLRALRAGPGAVVGLCLNRSSEMIVGALGILKAGAAYLPMDPDTPAERLAFILRDAGVQILVTQETELGRGIEVVHLDALGGSPRTGHRRPPAVAITGDDIAYVIYTSGSTGQPKGVQITHASLMNLVRWHQRAFTVVPADR